MAKYCPPLRGITVLKSTDKEIAGKLGRTIAEYRQRAGLTQAQVAERLDLSNDAVSRMERGDIMPSIVRLMQFAEVFNCETTELIMPSTSSVADQSARINQLLENLTPNDRSHLISIIESLVQWYNCKN